MRGIHCGLAAIVVALVACRPANLSYEEIVLPAGVEPSRWITIEFGNPSCPPAGDLAHRRIVVSADGYACTSTSAAPGWVSRSFSALASNGRRLDVSDRIHREHSIASLSSGNRGERTCKPDVLVFWYGDREKIGGDSAAAYRQRHPECPPQ